MWFFIYKVKKDKTLSWEIINLLKTNINKQNMQFFLHYKAIILVNIKEIVVVKWIPFANWILFRVYNKFSYKTIKKYW